VKRLRVAIAGAGMVAAHHVVAWRRAPAVDLVAVADPDADRARAFAERHGIGAAHADAQEMLARHRPDALDVAASHDAHAALCRAAAARGVAILCQKPLAPTLGEAQAIAREVGDRVRLMVHENWRFRPWYRQAGEWVRSGRIGTLRHASVVARGSGLLADGRCVRAALARQPMLAGLHRLTIGEVLVHHLDVACWLCGPLALRFAAVRRDVPEVRGDSAAVLVLTAAGGSSVLIDGDLAAHGAPPRVDDTFELLGSRGAIRHDGRRLRADGEEIVFEPQDAYQASYDGAIRHFADALRRDLPFETPAASHLEVLALVEAAYAVAAAG
jgi:predicted dehydrogenase